MSVSCRVVLIGAGDKKKKEECTRTGEWHLTFHSPLVSRQTKADHADNAEVELTRCSRGHYFGELALVTNKPRAASAYAVGDVKCLGETKFPSDLLPSNQFTDQVALA